MPPFPQSDARHQTERGKPISTETETTRTPLAERLRARIGREGPISFHDWMQSALYDPYEGYYCRRDRVRWGRAGDYRTAPGRSTLFAATFARYFATLFVELGSPPVWTIIEAGAGSGDFARGVLGSFQAGYPKVFSATRYLIDEISSDALEQNQETLSQFGERVEFRRLDQIEKPAANGIIFSNELLDAFPIHRVTRRGGKLRELGVGMGDAGEFVWVEGELTSRPLADYLERPGVELSEGQIIEINLEVEDWIARAAATLARGFVVAVDYGAEREELLGAPHRQMGTLRAFHRHQLVDNVLARPGEQDLTATIDWTQIRQAAERANLTTVRFETLGRFLLNEGLLEELDKLVRERDEVETMRLRAGARDMIMPQGMAAAFQVLILRKAKLAR